MRKRLDLASALIHGPKLLFLDEPTTGLDTQSRAAIWEYLEGLNRNEGLTVFLTTQYLEEADRLCGKLAVIDHGKLIATGSPTELKESIGGDTVTLDLKDVSLRPKAKEVLKGVPGVVDVVDSEGGIVSHVKNAGEVIASIVSTLEKNGIQASFLSIATPSLDDVFLRQTGRRIRPDELARRETEPFLM